MTEPGKYSVHKAQAARLAAQHEPHRQRPQEEEKDAVGRLAFLQVVLDVICNVERDVKLQCTIADLTQILTDTLPPLHAANLYRKAHGNIGNLLSTKDFNGIFRVEHGSLVRLEHEAALETAMARGAFGADAMAQCRSAWHTAGVKERRTLFAVRMNLCTRCSIAYKDAVQGVKACGGEQHSPKFDWTKAADAQGELLECVL